MWIQEKDVITEVAAVSYVRFGSSNPENDTMTPTSKVPPVPINLCIMLLAVPINAPSLRPVAACTSFHRQSVIQPTQSRAGRGDQYPIEVFR